MGDINAFIPRGGRGDFRGSRGGDGFRGRGYGFRGFGDGFRGSRGGGSFRGRGGRRGFNRDDRNGPPTTNYEIGDGLTLMVNFKRPMADVELKNQLKHLHMVWGSKRDGYFFLLFKSFEATKKAHKKLSRDDNVESVQFRGCRSPTGNDEITKLVLCFEKPTTIEAVKQLDDLILDVTPFSNKPNTFFAEFPSSADAIEAEKELIAKKQEHGIAFVRYSQGLRSHVVNKLHVLPNNVCLRDVPKTTTLQEILALAPSAVGVRIFKNTFPASDYCHAAIDFSSADEAKSFISEHSGSLKLNKKKVYVFPGLKDLLSDGPEVGVAREPFRKRDQEETEAKKEEPEAKKLKLENPDEEEGSGEDDDESGDKEAESGGDKAESGDDEEGEPEGEDEEEDDDE